MSAGGQGLPQPPPGMSVYAAKRVIGESQWSAEQLEQVQSQYMEDRRIPPGFRYVFSTSFSNQTQLLKTIVIAILIYFKLKERIH